MGFHKKTGTTNPIFLANGNAAHRTGRGARQEGFLVVLPKWAVRTPKSNQKNKAVPSPRPVPPRLLVIILFHL